jgi:polyisoprenyl-phosphate glycosyltransferase
MGRLLIVTPVLDDWAALRRLLAELALELRERRDRVSILIVDDGSSAPLTSDSFAGAEDYPFERIEMLHLAVNLGHQRAIAVGLTEAAARRDIDAILVMDCDGEDRPEDAAKLIAAAASDPDTIVFAQRAKRSEGTVFRAGHAIYKLLFRALAGQTVDFGNFSVLPIAAARRLCYAPDLWNNLPAAILRARLPHRTMPTERGRRYAGASKMNWVSLVIHGLSALSVYSDVIFVRLLIAASAFAGLAVIGILVALVVRLATDLAIPGWTSTVVGIFLILLVQMGIAVIVTAILILGRRSARPFMPINDCALFIAKRETIAAFEPGETVEG